MQNIKELPHEMLFPGLGDVKFNHIYKQILFTRYKSSSMAGHFKRNEPVVRL